MSLLNLSCGRAYFPFFAFVAFLAAGFALLAAGFAAAFFLASFLLAGDTLAAAGFSTGLLAFGTITRGPAAFFISAGVALWTRVKRVWSPIVWKLQSSAT
ncbi:MAG: hypothetical protein H0W53_14835, partial [Acidobacteria bacterium]|nr:hypothetical protein [Acidobacteriota bacterium]